MIQYICQYEINLNEYEINMKDVLLTQCFSMHGYVFQWKWEEKSLLALKSSIAQEMHYMIKRQKFLYLSTLNTLEDSELFTDLSFKSKLKISSWLSLSIVIQKVFVVEKLRIGTIISVKVICFNFVRDESYRLDHYQFTLVDDLLWLFAVKIIIILIIENVHL